MEFIISGKSKTDVFTDKGFVITSSDREIASMYAQRDNAVIMHITVPKGSNIIDSAKLPKSKCQILKNQKEVLLPRNAQFKITSYNPKTKVVEAVYLGQKYPLTIPENKFNSGAAALSDLNKTLLNFQVKNEL